MSDEKNNIDNTTQPSTIPQKDVFEKPKRKPRNPAVVKGGPPLNPYGRPKGSQNLSTRVREAFLNSLGGSDSKSAAARNIDYLSKFFNNFIEEAIKNPAGSAARTLFQHITPEQLLKEMERAQEAEYRRNNEFMNYRLFIRGFDKQQQVLLSKSDRIGLMCGRRAGKSKTNELLGVQAAIKDSHQRALIIGLSVGTTEKIYRDGINNLLTDLGIEFVYDGSSCTFKLDNNSIIQLSGNANKAEQEKYRGLHWDLIIVDEAQSQRHLTAFMDEVIKPMLLDTKGRLVLTGSGPRTRGTAWEKFYVEAQPSDLRLNWNISNNPHIADYQSALAGVREREHLEETDALYLREYLGQIVYDDDALVYRMKDQNYFTDADIVEWLKGQSSEDIRFMAGLDFGIRDSDGLAVIMYSEKRNEKFLVYEYKKSGTGFVELMEAIKDAKRYIAEDPIFSRISPHHRQFNIFADTSEAKWLPDARTHHEIGRAHV